MVALMARALENPEENETGGDGGVKDTEEDECRDHKGERNLFVGDIAQGSECWGRVILCAGISVDNRSHQTEHDDLGNGDGPQGLGEILGVLHLCNEAGDGDLSDECVANVQKSIHAANECGASSWDDEHNWVTDERAVRAAGIEFGRMGLDACKNRGEENGNEGKECRDRRKLGQRVEGPGQ